MNNKALMIAFHFPPWQGSSGVQRTLKFCRYLPENGWEPIILTIHPRAYQSTSDAQLSEIPSSVHVARAFGLDTARHLSIGGRYPAWFAWPDRWVTWWLGAVMKGLALIRRHRPALLWSTYPIATAHLIGLTLSRLSGIPWIADFRDSMTEDHYPRDPGVRRVYRWIERHTVERCHRAVFTTPGTRRMYEARYCELDPSLWVVIENGYDEENFSGVERVSRPPRIGSAPTVLVHSGLLYPAERDPRVFFSALGEMKRAGRISSANLQIVLRASGHDDHYRPLLEQDGLTDIIRLEPAIPYQAALQEMVTADGLLVFQASNCNHQIPAKIYEYLRAQRPILALTDPAGDTAAVLSSVGVDSVVPLDDKESIVNGLGDFLDRVRAGTASIARREEAMRFSRQAQTEELAHLFSSIVPH